jgi:hypothetical protein
MGSKYPRIQIGTQPPIVGKARENQQNKATWVPTRQRNYQTKPNDRGNAYSFKNSIDGNLQKPSTSQAIGGSGIQRRLTSTSTSRLQKQTHLWSTHRERNYQTKPNSARICWSFVSAMHPDIDDASIRLY